MSELKRCPFCGGEARLQHRQRKRGYYVICKECGCRTPLFQYQYDSLETLREEAITAWNHRKPMDDIVERLEELRLAEYDDSDEEPSFTDVEDWYDDGVRQGRYEAFWQAIKIVKGEV